MFALPDFRNGIISHAWSSGTIRCQNLTRVIAEQALRKGGVPGGIRDAGARCESARRVTDSGRGIYLERFCEDAAA